MTKEQLNILNHLNNQVDYMTEASDAIFQTIGAGDEIGSDSEQLIDVRIETIHGIRKMRIEKRFLRSIASDLEETAINLNDEFKAL